MAIVRTKNYAIDGDKLVGIGKDAEENWFVLHIGGTKMISQETAEEWLSAIGPSPETANETETH